MSNPYVSAMQKAGLSLAFFAFISVVLVALTDKLTASKIEENKAMMLLNALHEIAPENTFDNDLAASKIILTAQETGFARDTPVYLATLNNQPATAIFEVTTLKGYSGAMTLLIGVNAKDKTLTGVRVVQHKETPGLGDKIETRKSPWILDFDGKSLSNPDIDAWAVKKDGGEFDQFTGATITPRAIVNLVKSTLFFADNHLPTLFNKLQATDKTVN